jgi:hypothetical protein
MKKLLKKVKKLFQRQREKPWRKVFMVAGPLIIAIGIIVLMQPAGFNVGSSKEPAKKMIDKQVDETSNKAESIVDKSKETYLNYEKPVFARVHEDGTIDFLDDPVYVRGEPVHFALMKVGPFEKDEEGKNWVDMDMLVIGPDGDVAMKKENLLGTGGHLVLENDTAPSPSGVYVPTRDVKIGNYTIELKIYDKIGGGEVSDSGTFTLK